jgi:hypothetical protein
MGIALAFAHMIFPNVSTYTLVFIVTRDSDLTDVIIPAPILSETNKPPSEKKAIWILRELRLTGWECEDVVQKLNYYSQLLIVANAVAKHFHFDRYISATAKRSPLNEYF